jgi:hypothetical protein
MDCTGRGTRVFSGGLLGLMLATAVLLGIVLLDGQPAGAQAESGSDSGYGGSLGSGVGVEGLEGDNLDESVSDPPALTETGTFEAAEDDASGLLRKMDEPLAPIVLAQRPDARSGADRTSNERPTGQRTDTMPNWTEVTVREPQTRDDGLPLGQDGPQGSDPKLKLAAEEHTAVLSTGTAAPGHGAEAGIQVAQVVGTGDGEAGDRPLAEQSGRVVPAVMHGDVDHPPVVMVDAYHDSPRFYTRADHDRFVGAAFDLLNRTEDGRITWKTRKGHPDLLEYSNEKGTVILNAHDGDDKTPIDANSPISFEISRPSGETVLNWHADKRRPDELEQAYANAVYPLYQAAFRTTHEKLVGQLKGLLGQTAAGEITWQQPDKNRADRMTYSGPSGSVSLESFNKDSVPPIKFQIVGPEGDPVLKWDTTRRGMDKKNGSESIKLEYARTVDSLYKAALRSIIKPDETVRGLLGQP